MPLCSPSHITDTGVISKLWLLRIKPPWNSCTSLFVGIFFYFSRLLLRSTIAGCCGRSMLNLIRNWRSSKMAVPPRASTSSLEFLLLHTFANAWHHQPSYGSSSTLAHLPMAVPLCEVVELPEFPLPPFLTWSDFSKAIPTQNFWQEIRTRN